MGIVFVLLKASLVLAAIFVFAFRWAVRSGQFDDVHHDALRALFDDPRPDPTRPAAIAPAPAAPALEEKRPDGQ